MRRRTHPDVYHVIYACFAIAGFLVGYLVGDLT